MSLNKNMKVFIVDDYTTMLRILRNLLRQLELNQVEEATDGETAFQMMLKTPPDLIISDWNMAPMTGFAAEFLAEWSRCVSGLTGRRLLVAGSIVAGMLAVWVAEFLLIAAPAAV